jgi:hypothetical protein
MAEPNLISISISAFMAVFLLLTVLSLIIVFINKIFPHKQDESDYETMLAVIGSSLNNLYPNSKITHIEEVK